MSRRSIKIKVKNNLRTRGGRSVNKRSSRLFHSATETSVTETVLLYKLVFLSRKAALLSVLLCLCFLSQPFQSVYADEPDAGSVTVLPPAPEISVEISPPEPPPPPMAEESSPMADQSALQPVNNVVIEQVTTDNAAAVVPYERAATSENKPRQQTEQSNPEPISHATSSTSAVNKPVTTQSQKSTTSAVTEDAVTLVSMEVSVLGATSSSGVGISHADTGSVESESGEVDGASDNVVGDTSAGQSESEAQDDNVITSDDAVSDNPPTSESDGSEVDGEEIVEEIFNDGKFVSIVESDSAFSFNQNECTRIEDGSFYCQKLDSAIGLEDSLVALPDGDGDLEIFLVKDGAKTQITSNLIDDASPYYDEYSKTIVWHRLVNDRYQIISYDIATGEESQMTSGNVNNMEPTRHGDYTVWQRWVDNNWEIILYESGKEKQLTDSPRHDIAPHVRGPLVIWNSRSNDGTQSLKTYDIQSRTYTTIADGDGVSVSNPRMVVMYEAMYENGDVVMKGFDLVSGKIVPLQSLPRQLPEKLPDTDSTGETRAMIQSKPAPKNSEVINSAPTTPPPSGDSASSSPLTPDLPGTVTLDLRATSTDNVSTSTPTIVTPKEIATSTIPDLVIQPIISVEQAISSQLLEESAE